jgi:hypothetical protein
MIVLRFIVCHFMVRPVHGTVDTVSGSDADNMSLWLAWTFSGGV